MRKILTSALVFLLLAGAASAQQSTACGDRTEVLSKLKDKYHEAPSGFGMTGSGAVVELMTSDSGSWTLVVSFPDGRSCLMAAGENWELWKTAVKGKDA